MRDEAVFGKEAFLTLVDGIQLIGAWGNENANIPWLQLKADGVYLVPPPSGRVMGITWPEIKRLYDLPENTSERPILVLSFPFSKDSFLQFIHRFNLEGDCNFVSLEAISKRWHTIDKASERLSIEPVEIFQLLKVGDISFSVYLVDPVFVKEIGGNGSLKKIVGLFEVDGLRHLNWTESQVSGINLFRVCLSHEEIGFTDNRIGVHCKEFCAARQNDPFGTNAIVDHTFLKSQIVISDENLRDYLKSSKAMVAGPRGASLEIASEATATTIPSYQSVSRKAGGKQEKGGRRRQRQDALAVEIDGILNQGTPANVNSVWAELVKRCGSNGCCCLYHRETNNGPVIDWRGSQGQRKTLTKKALESRLIRTPR